MDGRSGPLRPGGEGGWYSLSGGEWYLKNRRNGQLEQVSDATMSLHKEVSETLERLKHPDLHWMAEFDYRDNHVVQAPHRTRLRRKSLLIYGKRGFRLPPREDVIELL